MRIIHFKDVVLDNLCTDSEAHNDAWHFRVQDIIACIQQIVQHLKRVADIKYIAAKMTN